MTASISIISAMDQNRLIGQNNSLPWHLPADLAFFKKNTLSKPIIMGRKTFQSIGKALPGRQNIVITRDASFRAESCDIASTIDQAIELAGDVAEVMLIGGASLYQQALGRAQHLYLTKIHATFTGDTWFPEINMDEWKLVKCEKHTSDQKNKYAYSFLTLSRIIN